MRVIGVRDGLPSSYLNDIDIDSDGYVWMATYDGLARYDGVETRVWQHDPTDAGSLSGNYLTVLHVDDQDRVWIAPEGRGLDMLDTRRGRFRHYRMETHPAMGSDEVFTIASRDGVVWFGTYGGGLHRLAADGTITRFMPRDGDQQSLPSETVLSLEFDSRGTLWIGTMAGLARWTGSGIERVLLPVGNGASMVTTLTRDGREIWVGAVAGLWRLQPDAPVGTRWSTTNWSSQFFRGKHALAMTVDAAGGYWLGTQAGLLRVDPASDLVRPVDTVVDGRHRPIHKIVEQSDGGLWFPLQSAGLGYLRPDWRQKAEFSQARGQLNGESYRSLAQARSGGLWLLGKAGEVGLLRQGTLESVASVLKSQLEKIVPLAVLEDQRGRLWVGGSSVQGSLGRIDPATMQLQQWWSGGNDDPTFRGPLSLMALGPDGTLWTSNAGGGIQQRDVDNGRVLRSIPAGDGKGVGVGDLEAMQFGPDGDLWIAGGEGLSHWSDAERRFRPIPGVVSGDRVFGFAFDGGSTLWLQRLPGLERYRRVGERWERDAAVGPSQGIPSVEGSGLAVDGRHRVWLATQRGLYRWDPDSKRTRHFGLQDGFSSQEFIDRGTVLTDDGIFGGLLAGGGVVLVDTRAQDSPPRTQRLVAGPLSVRRDGRWVELTDATPDLQPKDRELRVQMRMLSFDDPGGNRYATRLDGYDEGWVEQGSSGERILAGLAPGDYTLRARGVDTAGNRTAERQLHFTVLPSWWQTSWARVVATALLLLIGWIAARTYQARLRRLHAAQVADHEHMLAQQASLAKTRFLATLGHEVRTPMTGVLGMSELLLGTSLDTRQRGFTKSIHSAGQHLLRLVNDALDLARIESGKLELLDAPFDLRSLVDEVCALMAPLARRQGLAFDLDIPDDLPDVMRGDRKRVCQILLNLLGNATKFTAAGGVSLRVCKGEGDDVVFAIRDTGPGLNDEQKQRLFHRFEQAEGARTEARYGGSGLGLAICQELAAAMGGQIGVDSKPGMGSCFRVTLPLPAASIPATVAPDAVGVDISGPLQLLLVEDDPTVADVIVGLLEVQGHEVTHVPHGLAALAEVATARFDLALLDLDLPGLDGLALARQLRGQGFTGGLLAITARADADAEPQAHAAGFDGFLRKPATSAMLARALTDALA